MCVLSEILHNKKEQEENDAREVLREQLDQGWQGLTTEVAEICQAAGIPNACYKYINRKKVVEAIELLHMKEIKEQMEKLKLSDTRQMQAYMKEKSLENSRLEFQWQTNMIDTRVNMKGKYSKDKYECPHCPEGRQPGGSLETSDHLLDCRVYKDLREGLDPEGVVADRVTYLRKEIVRRTALARGLRLEL